MNVPGKVRSQIRAMARDAGRTEAEVARELLIQALSRARREAFYRRVAERQTDKLRIRDLEILKAFERLGG